MEDFDFDTFDTHNSYDDLDAFDYGDDLKLISGRNARNEDDLDKRFIDERDDVDFDVA